MVELQATFFDRHDLSPPSLRAVYFITTPYLQRHCERLGKPRGNPCNTMCGGLKNGSPRFARDDAEEADLNCLWISVPHGRKIFY
jgi:hypothetical protein